MFIRPDYNLKSIYDINLEELKQNGIKGMLFDLDSTLMASKSGEYSKEVLDWLDIVKKNFFVGVISNNHNSKYVEKVTKISNFPVLFNAEKPRVKKAMKFIIVKKKINIVLCFYNIKFHLSADIGKSVSQLYKKSLDIIKECIFKLFFIVFFTYGYKVKIVGILRNRLRELTFFFRKGYTEIGDSLSLPFI